MKSTIYSPSGLASENCSLALNTMDGCIHGCAYCYVPLVRHVPRETFHKTTRPRIRTEDIEITASKWVREKRPVQLCFTTDPYQKDNVCCGLTRAAIDILHRHGFPVSILTKGGPGARHDFDLFRPGDSFGQTITFLDEKKCRQWEPGAAAPEERMQNLMEAKLTGIDTYISLEPVIDPNESIAIIHATARFTDHYKVGPLNYYHGELLVPQYDRKQFITDLINTAVVKYKRGLHIKKSMTSFFGNMEGCRLGMQLPDIQSVKGVNDV
jgi:DNA repair photolyase